MVVAVGSNLYSETWNTIHALISGNVVDPTLSARSTTKLKMIFGAFPDVENSRPDFPIIVIENPKITSDQQTFARGNVEKSVDVSVWAYSKSNQQLNVLVDDINDAFMANRNVLQGSGLNALSIRQGAAGTDIIGNQRVHFAETIASITSMVV